MIFGTADRAEAARRLARLYFRIWPGLPIDVEWIDPVAPTSPANCSPRSTVFDCRRAAR